MGRKRKQGSSSNECVFVQEQNGKKCKISNDESRVKKLIQIQSWHPTEPSKMMTEIFEVNDSLDDSLFSALAEFSKNRGYNLNKVDTSIVTQIRQHLVDFATRLSVKNSTKSTVWSHYCHHIYSQHQKTVRDLRECDLNPNEDNEIQAHVRAKEAYRKYMLNPKTPGSLLEVFFASMRYDLNCIVIQYTAETKKLFIYNINPHYTNRIYLINLAEPERGKWRHLEPSQTQTPLLGFDTRNSINPEKLNQPTPPQVGIYTIVKRNCQTADNMFLQIEQSVKPKVCDRMSVATCDLALFNRLLLGAATIDEFTLCMENPESQGNYKIPSCFQTALSKSPQYELEQLFKARISPTESNYACPFQSMENIGQERNVDTTRKQLQQQEQQIQQKQQQQHPLYIFNNITNKLHNLGQNVNEHINSTPRQISRDFDCQNQNSRRSMDLDSFLLNNFNFTLVPSNPMVQTAILVSSHFGSPQILIRLEVEAKLTYESNTTMYMMILNQSTICLQFYDFYKNQWQPSQLKTQDFTIDPKTCFRLDNTSDEVVYIRCSWFSPCT